MENRICFNVSQYAACRRFYDEVVGWPIHVEWNRSETDQGVVYAMGSGMLELMLAAPNRSTTFDGTFYLYLEVPDVESLRAGLAVRGGQPTAIINTPWGHDSFYINDPAGLRLKFFKWRPGFGPSAKTVTTTS